MRTCIMSGMKYRKNYSHFNIAKFSSTNSLIHSKCIVGVQIQVQQLYETFFTSTESYDGTHWFGNMIRSQTRCTFQQQIISFNVFLLLKQKKKV